MGKAFPCKDRFHVILDNGPMSDMENVHDIAKLHSCVSVYLQIQAKSTEQNTVAALFKTRADGFFNQADNWNRK